MQWLSAHGGLLRTLSVRAPTTTTDDDGATSAAGFSTGLAALDALAPRHGFARGAVHEILSDAADDHGGGGARSFALLLARAAAAASSKSALDGRVVVWSDPRGEVYPPALATAGLPWERLLLLRAADPADELWAVAECLACPGIAATVAAPPPRLSRVQARRLQLAAERGGGIGVLLRHVGNKRSAAAASTHYAAATRWLVQPARGDAAVQRWSVRLIHGHGGQVNQPITLEVCRDTNHVRAIETLADRPAQATPAVARASA